MGDRLSIGEFAQRTGLSVSAVRFYGERGLLVPADVDSSSGYRSYDECQVATGGLVRELRRLGFGLADVAAYIRADEDERGLLLEAHLARLERALDDARSVTRSLTTRREALMTITTLSATEFGRALDQVLPAAGHDLERPVLTCVLVEAKEGSLRLVATDAFRLVVRDLALSSDVAGSFRALVPAATLSRWRPSLPSEGDISVGVDDRQFVVRSDDGDVTVYAVNATFPDYEQLLAVETGASAVVVDRARLLSALEEFICDEDAVLLTASADMLRIEKRGEHVELPARSESPAVSVALRADFAADAARAAMGPEVVIEIATSLQPVVFRAADDGTCSTMVMPVVLA